MKENQVQIFQYNGSPVSFKKGDSVMLNATEMAKPFGKLAKDWLSNKSTKGFLRTLSAVRTISLTDLVVIKQGGNGQQGTWMHEDAALEFARWLSPAFAIWCNDRIKELLTTGVATITNDDEAIAYAMEVLNRRLAESKQRVQILEGENDMLSKENKELAPKAQYTDEVLQAPSTYTFSQMAKELNFTGVHTFIARLKALNLIYKQSGQYQLAYRFSGQGYTTTRTARFYHSDGTPDCSVSTVWTEKGRKFLHDFFAKKGGSPCLQ